MLNSLFKSQTLFLSVFIASLWLLIPNSSKVASAAFFKPQKLHTITKNQPNPLVKRVAVLGKDDRTPLPEKHQAIAAGIGILGQPGLKGWSCTAFCVAPNIIATNAHCIVRNPTMGKRLNLSKTLFILPSFKQSFTGNNYKHRLSYPEYVHAKKPYLSIYSGSFSKKTPLNSQGQDWAFTKLIHSVCKGRTLSFADVPLKKIKRAARKDKVFMIGYHGDKQMNERLYSKNCKIRSRNNPLYFLKPQRRIMNKQAILLPHTCDAFKGSSGSPIFLETKSGPKVVGINLGSLRYERYRIRRNRYTGKIISRKKLKNGKETNMAIQPKVFMAGLKRFEQETLLNSVGEFKQLQRQLKYLKLYRGRIDGILGNKTRTAIYNFEQQMKLSKLGLPTEQLLTLLLAETSKLRAEQLAEKAKQ